MPREAMGGICDWGKCPVYSNLPRTPTTQVRGGPTVTQHTWIINVIFDRCLRKKRRRAVGNSMCAVWLITHSDDACTRPPYPLISKLKSTCPFRVQISTFFSQAQKHSTTRGNIDLGGLGGMCYTSIAVDHLV